jgi:hypothetical protein
MYFSYFLGWPDDLMVFHEVFEEIALQHTGQEIKTSLLSGFKKKKKTPQQKRDVMAQTSLLVFRKACQQLKLRGQRRKN